MISDSGHSWLAELGMCSLKGKTLSDTPPGNAGQGMSPVTKPGLRLCKSFGLLVDVSAPQSWLVPVLPTAKQECQQTRQLTTSLNQRYAQPSNPSHQPHNGLLPEQGGFAVAGQRCPRCLRGKQPRVCQGPSPLHLLHPPKQPFSFLVPTSADS